MTLKLDRSLIRKKNETEDSSETRAVLASAVKFLKNEKVRTTPLRRRILFLKSKGMKTEQIFHAFRMADQPIQRQQIEEIEPDISITAIQTFDTRDPAEQKWSIRRSLAVGAMGIFSVLGAYQVFQWMSAYEIRIRLRKTDEQDEDTSEIQVDYGTNAKLRKDLATLHSELARSKTEARIHLQHVDRILIEKQKLESEIESMRHQGDSTASDNEEGALEAQAK